MKTYQIFLHDCISKKVEKIENLKGEEQELKERLLELQKGYCEDEKPSHIEKKVTSQGMLLNVCFATSYSDFSYGAVLSVIK
jgi:hypothetical protein